MSKPIYKMPYTISNIPEYVKKYPEVIQRMFVHTFNSVYEKSIKEGETKHDAEKKAIRGAQSVIKSRLEKFGFGRYGHNSMIHCIVDKWLGNLK